jgi:hypothetical protein
MNHTACPAFVNLLVTLLVLSTSGCASLIGLLPFPIPGLGGTGSPIGEEQQILYAKGIRAMMPDPIKDLKISPTERVWIVNKVGGTNSDSAVDGLTYDAIVDSAATVCPRLLHETTTCCARSTSSTPRARSSPHERIPSRATARSSLPTSS